MVVFHYIWFPIYLIYALTFIILRRGLQASNCSTSCWTSVAGIRGLQKASQWWWAAVHRANDSYLWVGEPGEVRVQVELDAFGGPRQRDPSDQENQKHNIGECRSDIYNLPKKRETRIKTAWQWWEMWQAPNISGEQRASLHSSKKWTLTQLSLSPPFPPPSPQGLGLLVRICWVPTMVIDITAFQTFLTTTHRKKYTYHNPIHNELKWEVS